MDETSLQMVETMEMVPIGKIEDVAKKEYQSKQRRYNSIGRGNQMHENSRYGGGSRHDDY